MADYDWLDARHPTYDANKATWEMLERRFHGGQDVLTELVPFDWEEGQVGTTGDQGEITTHYDMRKNQAAYINFPELTVRQMIGHLFSKEPEADVALDFGTLGKVGRDPEADATPSRAELVYENTDGIGNDTSRWPNFWIQAAARAAATGHRWIFIEATREAPATLADEIAGARPYLIEYSPLAVTNWHYVSGRLEWAILRISERRPFVKGGDLEDNKAGQSYLLFVRQGVEALGDEFKPGGWWMFNSDREMLMVEQEPEDESQEPRIVPVTGQWESTKGEIPFFPFYYERVTGRADTMSRSGIYELSQIAVAYMNLDSAANFDAWDAAMSVKYFLGVDSDSFKLAMDMLKSGSKYIPIPASKHDGTVPTVEDGSTGAVAAEVFEKRLDRMRQQAAEIAALEASSEPGSSGVSKRAGFADLKAPRLALMASEIEAAQRKALRFLELRFSGGTTEPTSSVTWEREYDLLPLVDSVTEIFELMELGELDSATLKTKGVLSAAQRKGLVADETEEAIVERELRESAANTNTNSNREGGEAALIRAAVARAQARAGGTPAAGEPAPL